MVIVLDLESGEVHKFSVHFVACGHFSLDFIYVYGHCCPGNVKKTQLALYFTVKHNVFAT